MNSSHASAAEGNVPSAWLRKLTQEEVNQLPVTRWQGPICLVRTAKEAEEAVAVLAGESVLGFDTETRPAFRKGENYFPALLQLAGADRVYLFQLKGMNRYESLVSLLGNACIRKVGVGLDYDVRALQTLFAFQPQGFIDVGEVARRALIGSQGLRGLAAHMFGVRISKRAQCSNWEATELKKYQLIYAATDAWISREIYLVMQEKGLVAPVGQCSVTGGRLLKDCQFSSEKGLAVNN